MWCFQGSSHCNPNGTARRHSIILQFWLELPSHPPGNAQIIVLVFCYWSLAVLRSNKGLTWVSPGPRTCKKRTLPRASPSCGLTEQLWGHLPASHNQTGKVQGWNLSHLPSCVSNYLPIYCMALLGGPGKPARCLLLHGCSGWRLTRSGIV